MKSGDVVLIRLPQSGGGPTKLRPALVLTSSIRLSYLYAAEQSEILGRIGTIDPNRLQRLLVRLARHIKI